MTSASPVEPGVPLTSTASGPSASQLTENDLSRVVPIVTDQVLVVRTTKNSAHMQPQTFSTR